ncbi:metallophosphoesterase [Acinetobacter sp. ANC 4805]|uniref:metallophosphoesterase n=1 Tax=Acinetobacter sp. ANC 4805 TaxID=2923425 RepID=UPI001F4B0107|nr:metallophosphoesterase [Acinetobacter sp. ANC 4805]MCH7310539.1 metallophosphoesterase [Acinetobacter sp. ANC 4805]
MIRILHFSDLHLHTNYDQEKVLESFLKDIQSNGTFDLVVCSGDIAARGNFQKDNILAFFSKIKEIVGKKIPIVTCPGNHDINLKKRKSIYDVMYNNVTSYTKANTFFNDLHNEPDSNILGHLKDYNEIASEITLENLENKIFFTKEVDICQKKVGIASLNSAWFTKGGGRNDYGNLYIAQHQVERAADEIRDCELKIAVLHHPLDWISPDEKTYIQNTLTNNFDLLLCGHMHNNSASTIASNLGSLFVSNTGCIYENRQYFNGYSIIEIQEGSIRTIAREYYDQRNTFDKSIRFSSDSTTLFSFEKKKEISLISGEIIRHINLTTNQKLLSTNSGVAPQELSTIFVEPPLSHTSEKEYYALAGNSEKSKLTTLDELYKSDGNIIFFGKRESGKSTLLNFIITNEFQKIYPQAQLGIVIDLEKARINDKNITRSSILTAAINFLDGILNKRELIELLTSGSMLVAFDNLSLKNKNDERTINSFITEFSSSKYIASATEPEMQLSEFTYNKDFFKNQIHIHSFKKYHTEKLIQNWFIDDLEASQNNIKLVNKLIDQLNVPSTPFLISMLLWVVEKNKNNSHLFNEASVVQVLIEGLLNKFGEEKKREDFDSTNISHFLKQFSYYLDSRKLTNISIADFDKFKIQYFADLGLHSKENLRTELIEKGLLYGDSNLIGFKFDCFRSFFLAEHFNNNEDFWLNIINNNQIQDYSIEFEYYSGIYRDKERLLVEFHNAIKKIFSTVNFNANELSLENETGILLSESIFGDISLKIDSHNEHQNEEIILDTPNRASIDHSVSREKIKTPNDSEHFNALVALKTFAAILRNSELVPKKLKEDSLEDLFTYWDQVFSFLLSIVKNDFDVIKPDDINPEEEQDIKQFFTLVITFVYSYVIVEKSSSPKMKVFFEKYFESKNSGHRALAILCYIDIDIKKSIEVTKKSLPFFNKKSFYLQAIYIFYLHKFFENSKSKEITNAIKLILAEISFTMSGENNFQKTGIMNQTISRLEDQKNKIKHQEKMDIN